jgi:hypothetical protein
MYILSWGQAANSNNSSAYQSREGHMNIGPHMIPIGRMHSNSQSKTGMETLRRFAQSSVNLKRALCLAYAAPLLDRVEVSWFPGNAYAENSETDKKEKKGQEKKRTFWTFSRGMPARAARD